jgi:hypothetical protein
MYARMYDRMFERRGKGSFPVGKVFSQNRGVLRQVLLTFACIRSKRLLGVKFAGKRAGSQEVLEHAKLKKKLRER